MPPALEARDPDAVVAVGRRCVRGRRRRPRAAAAGRPRRPRAAGRTTAGAGREPKSAFRRLSTVWCQRKVLARLRRVSALRVARPARGQVGAGSVAGQLVDDRGQVAAAHRFVAAGGAAAGPPRSGAARPPGACWWPCRAAAAGSPARRRRSGAGAPSALATPGGTPGARRPGPRCRPRPSRTPSLDGGGHRVEPGLAAGWAAAQRTANCSRASRRVKSSSMSRADSRVTRTPRRGRCSTSPCWPSRRSASRSGARLVPNRRVSCSSTSRSPGTSAPLRISPRSRRTASSTRLAAWSGSAVTVSMVPRSWASCGHPADTPISQPTR